MGIAKNENQGNESAQNTNKQDELTNQYNLQIAESAKKCANQFNGRFNNKLDFSVKSLETIDAIIEEVADLNNEMLQEQKDGLVNLLGSYIFEVARRNYGGQYYWYYEQKEPILVTGQPTFEISLLVYDRIQGRIENVDEGISIFSFF
ncbi:MAG: hypothetical protein MI922_20915, partial [Bacteroidales bacterium]|nr:hypothetical protein [Bacteroidales bacterium]